MNLEYCLKWLGDHADALQTIIAIIGAVLAAAWTIFWLIYRRESYPKANLDITVDHVPLEEHGHLIRVVLHIQNVGPVLLKIERVSIFLHQILPVPHVGKDEEIKPFDFAYADNDQEFDWPALRTKVSSLAPDKIAIFEPGESGPMAFDFRLSSTECPRVLSVYAHVRNIRQRSILRKITRRKPDIGWCVSKIITLSNEPTTDKPAANTA